MTMKTLRQVLGLVALSAMPVLLNAQPAANFVKAEAMTSVESAKPGDTVSIGVQFSIDPDWHIYWKNPGESGFATEVAWKVEPAGLAEVGPTLYPAPISFTSPGDLVSFGYEDKVLLINKVKIPATAKIGDKITLAGEARWLMCSDRCIPGEAKVSVSITVAEETKPANADLFKWFRALVPSESAGMTAKAVVTPGEGKFNATVSIGAEGQTLVGEHNGLKLQKASFYPYEIAEFIQTAPKQAEPTGKATVDGAEVKTYNAPVEVAFVIEPLEASNTTKPKLSGVVVAQVVSADGKVQEPAVFEISAE